MSPLRVEDVEDVYGLTATQEGMLYECVKSGDPALYVEQVAWSFRGELNENAFRSAWARLIARHPALRTRFEWRLKKPVQIVMRQAAAEISSVQNVAAGTSPAGDLLGGYLASDHARGMALDRAPLLRVAFFKLDEAHTRVVMTGHHLILDAWSTRILMREWSQIYEHLAHSAALKLPAPVLFRDVVRWEKERDLKVSEAFWQRALASVCLPPPRPQRSVTGGTHRITKWQVSSECMGQLQHQARRLRVTLATLAHAAWAAAVAESDSTDNVTLGTIVSGRDRDLPGIDSIVGVLIHCIPLPIDVPRRGSVPQWVRSMQERYRDVIAHQHVPLRRIRQLRDVPVERTLFDSVVIFQNAGWTVRDQFGSLVVEDTATYGHSSYPLSVRFSPGSGTLELEVLWSTYQYSDAHIATLTRRLTECLDFFASMSAQGDADMNDLFAWKIGGRSGRAPALSRLKGFQPVPVARKSPSVP